MQVIKVFAHEVARLANESEHKSIEIVLNELSKKLCTKVELATIEDPQTDLLKKYDGVAKVYTVSHPCYELKIAEFLEMINKDSDVILLQDIICGDSELVYFKLTDIEPNVDYKMNEKQKQVMFALKECMHWINLPQKELDAKFREIGIKKQWKEILTSPIDCTGQFKEWAKDKCVVASGYEEVDAMDKEYFELFNPEFIFKPTCKFMPESDTVEMTNHIRGGLPIKPQNNIILLAELIKFMQKFNIHKSQLVYNTGIVNTYLERIDPILDAVIKPSNTEDLQKKLAEITKLLN